MTAKTNREKLTLLVEQASELDRRIAAAMSEYPGLYGWRLRLSAIKRTGPGEGDWIWTNDIRLQAKRARYFLREAVAVAASRISEAYGMGLGEDWAMRHFGPDENIADVGPRVLAGQPVRGTCRLDKRKRS